MDPSVYQAFRRIPPNRDEWDEASHHLATVRRLSALIDNYSADKVQEADLAISALANNPRLRNSLMRWPPDTANPPSIEFILQFFCGPLSSHPIDIRSAVDSHTIRNVSRQALRQSEHDRGTDLVSLFADPSMLFILPAVAPNLLKYSLAFSTPAFLKGLIGDEKITSNQLISVNLLFVRIGCAEFKFTEDGFKFDAKALGTEWERSQFYAHQFILEIEKDWHLHLTRLAATNPLDILAGVVVPGDRYKGINTEYFSSQPASHGSIDYTNMYLPGDILAGTATAWNTPLSPGFEAYALECGLTQLTFILDPHGGKERYISIESPNAIPGDDPVYLQVGSYPIAKLYKAQQSSTSACDVITIMNFIRILRDQFFKTRLEEGLGEAVAMNWTHKA